MKEGEMKKLFGFLTIVLVFSIRFQGTLASISEAPPSPSDFFEKRGACQEEARIKIINYTSRQISCLFIYEDKRVVGGMEPGGFFYFQVKNPYCYDLPVCSQVTIIIMVIDHQDKVIAVAAKELNITFSGLSSGLFPREETLIILPIDENSLKIERGE